MREIEKETPWRTRTSSAFRQPTARNAAKENILETKLYVGNLSYDTTETSLRNEFAKSGNVVSVDIIMDRDTGRMKGFAFVTMSSDEEAQAAINTLNETMLDNRAIKVNIAKPREDSSRRSYSNFGGRR